METSVDQTPRAVSHPHRSVSLLQAGAAAIALGFVSSPDTKQAPDLGTAPNASVPASGPLVDFAFPPNPADSPLNDISAPAHREITTAPATLPKLVPDGTETKQPRERDPRLLGPLTPSNPISRVASVPNDETFSPLWWAVAILAAGQIINTVRGIVKSREDFSAPVRRLRNRSRFEARRDLSSPSMNAHIFEYVSPEEGGPSKLQLSHVITKKKPKLATMIGNPEALRVFVAAAERCDEHEPFPSLKFGEAAETTIGKIRRQLGYPSEKHPRELQRVYLRELNKIFRDAYSELHKDGLLVKEREVQIRKAILSAFELNFPLSAEDKRAFEKVPLVHASWHRAIWICEVTPKVSRDLILADISDEMFEMFGDGAQVATLLESSPNHQQRILEFQDAFKREKAYQEQRGATDEPYLFPRVLVYTDISDKTVPAFIASLLAKYDRKDLAAQLARIARARASGEAGRGDEQEPGSSK